MSSHARDAAMRGMRRQERQRGAQRGARAAYSGRGTHARLTHQVDTQVSRVYTSLSRVRRVLLLGCCWCAASASWWLSWCDACERVVLSYMCGAALPTFAHPHGTDMNDGTRSDCRHSG
eukprot:7385332-Prymnesium_polylepis.1